MSDSGKDNAQQLSAEELVEARELQASIRKKLAILLADPRTPVTFKEAFTELNLGEEL